MHYRTTAFAGLAGVVAVAFDLGSARAHEMPVAMPASPPPAVAPGGRDSASDGLNLERVIVTGTAHAASKMKSSVSVSTLEAEQIAQLAPASAADVLRAIPGVRSESSGGEGNANITVRGVPISAGGARYVQLQEDGLPVLQFGDFNFITPDSYLKIDGTLDHVEAVRGGSASTMATNSPGGIINFIGRTGDETGRHVGISRGLNYRQTRLDADVGGAISTDTRFFVGGYYRTGEGARTTGLHSEQGGQIRGNLTHQFSTGYVRVSFKHLDDKVPTALPVPVVVSNRAIVTIAGIDPRKASFYSPFLVPDITLDKNNHARSTNVNDGLAVKSDSIGLEASLDIGDGWRFEEKMRVARNSGRFAGIFPADNGAIGHNVVATGPRKGAAYDGRAFNAVVFNTSIDDVGNALSDARLAKTFRLGDDMQLTTMGGIFLSKQKLGLTWNFNQYLMQATGDQPALLQTSNVIPGLVGPAFGGCCSRAVDMDYRLSAPYINVGVEHGPLNIDASVRHDRQHVAGTANIATSATPGGALRYDPTTAQLVNYRMDHTSYSVGGNFRFTADLAAFARVSDGVAFNADRILFGAPLDGSAPVNINTVKQREAGIKWRHGPFSSFMTLFQARTKETNYEATTQTSTANAYSAHGVELETAYRPGQWRISGGLTFTRARITGAALADAANIGNSPRRQARLVYQAATTYAWEQVTVGANLIGTGPSWADDAHTFILPSYRVINAMVNYRLTTQTTLSLYANNLFNTLGFTEAEPDGHAARAITGRAVKLNLDWRF